MHYWNRPELWYALWGPAGALVSVPITAILRISLVHQRDSNAYARMFLTLMEGGGKPSPPTHKSRRHNPGHRSRDVVAAPARRATRAVSGQTATARLVPKDKWVDDARKSQSDRDDKNVKRD
eukprot:g10020.t1